MRVSKMRCYTPTRGALQETNLEQVGLVNVFDRINFFTEYRSNRIDADRTAAESLNDGAQQFSVDFIEAVLVNVEQL